MTAAVAAACSSSAKDSGFSLDAGADRSLSDVGSAGGDAAGGQDGPTLLGDGGGGGACVPKTCGQQGFTCGQNSDGCGNIIDCGSSCPAGQICGGGGFNKCGVGDGGACIPATCASLGFDCGFAGDGCGGSLQCGMCATGVLCGGGGQSNVCGMQCTGLCKQQVTCDGGTFTTLTGRVTAPKVYGTPDPTPNVLVYVPNAPLQPFSSTLACTQCGADVSGNPLVTATTAFDGTFSLVNVPVGSNIPVVIQLGKWRREVSFNVTAPCTTTAVGDITMPSKENQGTAFDNIPLTAISTGSIDALECVLLKMGVDTSEFTPSSGKGRIHIYHGNGATIAGAADEAALMDTGGTFMNYDQMLFPCWAKAYTKTPAELANLVSYANGGGHFFATHFSYTWLFQNSPFDQVAKWNVNAGQGNSIVGDVDVAGNPKGKVFAEWLGLVGALSKPTPPQVTIKDPRHDVDSVNPGSVDWIDHGTSQLLHFTFDTPWAAKTQCGHAIYSDFHVTPGGGATFPGECDNKPMTPQEKILEYMIWDLGQCVGTSPPTCTPKTCAQLGYMCGPAGDGCGGALDCGPCTPPQTCGGGGTPYKCGSGSCSPKSCQDQGIACGASGDGCGNVLQCGDCMAPQTCGGGGTAGQCGGGSQ